MTEKTKLLQKKSKQNTSVKSLHKSLSIQFSLDGFSFSIEDITTNQIINFSRYTFETRVNTPEELLTKIRTIFHDNKELQEDFELIKVIHQNNLSTLVPNEYFSNKNLKTYLDYNIKTLVDDYITFDNLDVISAKNIYIPFVNINNYLFQNFGEFEFNHHSTILIDKLIKHTNKNTEKSFFVNVTRNNIDIIVVQTGKLILYNSFQYNTKEDFIYYILFVCEQLGIDTNKINLTFLGDITRDSETYKITYEYVRNVDFIHPKSTFFMDSEDFTNHSNYILIS